MRKHLRLALFIAAAVALSGCSLFEEDEGAESSTSGVQQLADDSAAPVTVSVPASIRTEVEIQAVLEALYATYGVEGTPYLQGGVWILRGTAADEATRTLLIGAARQVDGVSVTSSQIVLAGDAGVASPASSAAPSESA
ncbi:MAG: hypothetical protein P8N02_00810, partial [Actinomycetota bacterium]|nr:hypothetical protein [Actinomycetota bacterium]